MRARDNRQAQDTRGPGSAGIGHRRGLAFGRLVQRSNRRVQPRCELADERGRHRAAGGGLPAARRSFANSSGLFLGADFASDLARPGAALYGVNPTPGQPNPMQQVVKLSAPILQVRQIKMGETVGYEGAWTAQRPSRIATLGVGVCFGASRTGAWSRRTAGRCRASRRSAGGGHHRCAF